jgi:DNA topoisomerase-1
MNKHLSEYMPGLSAKVFRTYNASWTFQQELAKTDMTGTTAEKILAYNRANREVAVLCNHQRSVPKSHGAQMGKLSDKIKVFKYERMIIKKAMLANDPRLKKKKPEVAEDESDLEGDDEAIEEVEKGMREADVDKLKKKLEKTNEKINAKEAEGELVEEKEIEKMLKQHAKECGAVAMRDKIDKMTADRLEKRFDLLSGKISQQKLTQVDKVDHFILHHFRRRARLRHWERPRLIISIQGSVRLGAQSTMWKLERSLMLR